MVPERSKAKKILISPYEIHFLRFILEAYEGMAVVSTLDPELGLVELSMAPGCEEDVDAILIAERVRLKLRDITMNPAA